jgi:hypothetical protein
MTEIGIFIFGMFVFAVAIGASLIATIGASDPALNHPLTKTTTEPPVAAPTPQPQLAEVEERKARQYTTESVGNSSLRSRPAAGRRTPRMVSGDKRMRANVRRCLSRCRLV